MNVHLITIVVKSREPIIMNDILLKILLKEFFGWCEESTRSNFDPNIGKLIGMVHYCLNAIKWRTHLIHKLTLCVYVWVRIYVVNMKFFIVLTLRLSLSVFWNVLWSSVNTALKTRMHSYDFYYVLSAIFFFHQKPSSCVQRIIL